jgi:hypothetical protein
MITRYAIRRITTKLYFTPSDPNGPANPEDRWGSLKRMKQLRDYFTTRDEAAARSLKMANPRTLAIAAITVPE